MATDEETLRKALDLLTYPPELRQSVEAVCSQGLSNTEKRRLQRQLRQSRAWHLGGNIVSFGIAEKQQNAGGIGDLSLTVYVRKKYAKSDLPSPQQIPPILDLEGFDDCIPTDVREVGSLVPNMALTNWVRPVFGGYSIGHIRGTGTMGCLVVERGANGRRLVLGSCHVLAAAGTAQPGDVIYQPGPDERGVRTEAVATLVSWQPYIFGPGYLNRIDAALAAPINEEWFDSTIFDIGRPKGVRRPARGMMVQKTGRTTGHTYGRVLDVDNRPTLFFPRPNGEGTDAVRFVDQVLCTHYSEEGDSGALVLDTDGYALGLHFCGSPAVSIFSPIEFVLDDLGVDLVTEHA